MKTEKVFSEFKTIEQNFEMGFITHSERNMQVLDTLRHVFDGDKLDQLCEMLGKYQEAVKVTAKVDTYVDAMVQIADID